MTRIKPTTDWNTPRYSLFLEDINGINLEDINGVALEGISGNQVNALDTPWQRPISLGDGLWKEDILPWQEDFFPWLYGVPVMTDWNTPRYDTFIEDINGINLEDINGIDLEGISGNRVNVLDTTWT